MSEKKQPVDLGLLEEDDEFEEFPAEGAGWGGDGKRGGWGGGGGSSASRPRPGPGPARPVGRGEEGTRDHRRAGAAAGPGRGLSAGTCP